MDIKEIMGRNVKVFTEKTEFDDNTVGHWFSGKLIGNILIGSREFVTVRWEGDNPKERMIPLDRITLIEMD